MGVSVYVCPMTGAIPSSEPSSLDGLEFDGLRRQQTAFCILTLFVLAMLLLLHALFAFVLGEPSMSVLVVLGFSFAIRLLELMWLQSRSEPMTHREARLDGIASIGTLFVLAILLMWMTNRDHSPYQVLLAIPVLQSAFLFGLTTTVCTILAADSVIFLWLWRYFALHPPALGSEYLEAGMLAVIYALMGLLVWFLISQLRANQTQLAAALEDLERTRAKLISEEKLAAVGRLASGIAHEIRNPVAMIVSALSTARDQATMVSEREEMFGIASRQAGRLEALTTDFLTYAKPNFPHRSPVIIGDLLSAVESVARVRAAERSIRVTCRFEGNDHHQIAVVDGSQLEGALLNLAINAIDAAPSGGAVILTAGVREDVLRVDVENSGPAISAANLDKIFEPFFTTKAGGTGLGLAIARAVARAHAGDLWVSSNEDGHVIFTLTVSTHATGPRQEAASWAGF
jgi:two-component system, NtrC family, sensor histidine kinase HydH